MNVKITKGIAKNFKRFKFKIAVKNTILKFIIDQERTIPKKTAKLFISLDSFEKL